MRKVLDADQIAMLLLAFVLLAIVGSIDSHESTGNVVLEDLSVGENLGDDYGSLTAQHWAGLASGEVATQEGRTAYSQYVIFKDPAASDPIESCTVRFERDESGAVDDVLHCKKGEDIFEYQLVFEEGLQSGIDGDGQLEDIEDERIMMLGQEFIITQTKVDGNRIRLRLSGRPVEKLMAEGEKHTVVHDDKTYTVTVVSISDTTPPRVVLQVDGQTSSALEEKKAILIKGEFPIVVHEIIPNEGREAQGSDLVNLVFGSRSLDIQDTDYTDDAFTRSDVSVNGRRVIDSKLKIRATRSGNLFTISSIAYRLQAAGLQGDDVFVPAGQGLTEHVRNPYGLLSSAWDLRYGGLRTGVPAAPIRRTGGAAITFDARSDGYDLEFTNNNGISYDIPLLTKRGSTLAYGDDDNDLHFREGTNASDYLIAEKDSFIVTKGSDGRGSTHVLQFEGTADGKAVFTDLSGKSKILALFPTGAFFLFDWLFKGDRIEVPLEPVTGYQVLGQGGDQPDVGGQAQEDGGAQDAEQDAEQNAQAAADEQQFLERCTRAKATIKPGIGNTLAGEFGLYERGGVVSMKILGAEEFPICSEFFNFMMVEGLFPLKVDAFIDDCMRRAKLNDELMRCPNVGELEQEVKDACQESVSELVDEINSQEEEIRRIYEQQCLPQLQEEIDAWNRARGMTTPEPSSSNLILLPDGRFVEADGTADGVKDAPAADAAAQGAGDEQSSRSSPPDDGTPSEEIDEEFICCEYCPSTEYIKYYIPFAGNDCEPTDARRDDLSPEQCVNPFTEGMLTPETLENAPPIYGPNCPTPADLEQKEKQEKCEAAKKNYLALKAAYEALVPPVRAAWSAYQQSGYTDASAKARYDDAYQKAHDAYFKKMIPARDEAKRLCDGIVPDAPAAPKKDAAPSLPPSSDSDSTASGSAPQSPGTGTGGGTAAGGQAGPAGPSAPSPTAPSPLVPPSAPSEAPIGVPPAESPAQAPSAPSPGQAQPPLIQLPEPTALDRCIEGCSKASENRREYCLRLADPMLRDDCIRQAGIQASLCFAECKKIGVPSVPWAQGQRQVESCKADCDERLEKERQDCIARKKRLGEDSSVCDRAVLRDRPVCYELCEAGRPPVAIEPQVPPGQPPITIPLVFPTARKGAPKAARFDASLTTDFSKKTEEELSALPDVKIGREGAAKIGWTSPIDVRGLDLDALITIEPNKVTVDADLAPQLDAPAIITLENIDMKEPVIYKDGKPCDTCTIIEYDRGTKRLTFSTTGFSTFTAIDAAGLGRGTLTLSGFSYEFFVNAAGDTIVVDLDGDGDLDGSAVDIHTAGYGILELGAAGTTTDITLRTPARYTQNRTADETTTIRASITDSRVGITLPGLDTHDAGAWEEAMTAYGTHFALEDTTRGNDLVIDYPPAGQRFAGVGVVMGE